MQMYPLVEASSGQEQSYVRSALHLQSCIRLAWHFEEIQLRRCRHTPNGGIWWSRAVLHVFAHFMFSCCRGKSYIGIWIGDMSSWTQNNLCRLFCVVVVVVVTVSCCCCCCSSVIVDLQVQMNNNNNNKLHSNNKNNQNKEIEQFM